MATETTRANIAALIDQEQQNKIWEEAAKQSFALRHFTKVPMSSNQMRLRQVLGVNTPGGFVNGDTGRKPTYSLDYENKLMNAEEIAGLYVFNEASLEDSTFDLLGEARKAAAEKIALTLDGAVFTGANAPASWPDSLVEGAIAASQLVDVSGYNGTPAGNDRAAAYSDLLGVIEDNDLRPNLVLARPSEARVLRNLRDANGVPVYATSLSGGSQVPSVWGVPMEFVDNGSLGTATTDDSPLAITGDFSKAILGIRTAVEFKLLTEATITKDTVITNGTDPDQTVREVLYSLAEQDMLALRFRVRVGFQVMTPSSTVGGVNPYPFAVLGA